MSAVYRQKSMSKNFSAHAFDAYIFSQSDVILNSLFTHKTSIFGKHLNLNHTLFTLYFERNTSFSE